MTKIKVEIEDFSVEELTCRCGCGIFNYDHEFLVRLQAFRYALGKGLNVTSPGRCLNNNTNAGGVVTSCHQCETKKATAVDVTNSNCREIYERACECKLFNEVIWYERKNFVHLGLDRKQKGNYFTKA